MATLENPPQQLVIISWSIFLCDGDHDDNDVGSRHDDVYDDGDDLYNDDDNGGNACGKDPPA